MKFSDSHIFFSISERQAESSMYDGGSGPRPGQGIFNLFITSVILLVIVIAIIVISQLSSSDNDDVSYSGLGIGYRFQKQDDRIYYAEYNYSQYPGGLYRISSNGDEKKRIIDSGVDLFALNKSQIVYITHSPENAWILHTVESEGDYEKILYRSNEEDSTVIKMDVVNGQCYILDKSYKLHIIDLDSGKCSEFNDNVADFCIDGIWIYYLKAKSDSNEKLFQLWRTDIEDGTQNQQLMSSFESAIDYSDNKIYYINEEDGDIYSIDFFGEKGQKIIESEGIWFLKVIGDWIYYGNQDENPCLYKVKKNGEQNQKIDDYGMRMGFSIHCVCILDNWVWYGDMDDRYVSFTKMIRISDKHNTDDVIEDILEDMTPSWVIRKYE